jgi:nucleotide-binding universal stress UspA family protein
MSAQRNTTSTTSTTAPEFTNILMATDFSIASRAALQEAIRLSNKFAARLTVLHVFEYSELVAPDTGTQLTNMDLMHETAQKQLLEAVETAQHAGVLCSSKLTYGYPPVEIVAEASESDVNLVVLGTNAFHGFERLVFGSTAEAVLREAPCPVITVGPHARCLSERPRSTTDPIVFATDFHLTTVNAIRYAAAFCGTIGSPLHCLHVLPRTFEDNAQNIVPQIMTEALQQVVAEGGVSVDAPVYSVTYGSEVSNAVVDYARQHHARLVVLGVQHASLAASHTPPHIAYRVITEAPCPVLTMCFKSHPLPTVTDALPKTPTYCAMTAAEP